MPYVSKKSWCVKFDSSADAALMAAGRRCRIGVRRYRGRSLLSMCVWRVSVASVYVTAAQRMCDSKHGQHGTAGGEGALHGRLVFFVGVR